MPAKFLPSLPNCTNFIKCYEYPYSRSPISRKIKSFKFDNFLTFVFSFLPASLPFLVVKGIYLVTLDLSSISISIPRLRRSWIVEVTIDRAILMSKLALNRVWKNSLSPQEGMKRSSWRGDFRRFCSLRGILFFTPLILDWLRIFRDHSIQRDVCWNLRVASDVFNVRIMKNSSAV